MLIFGFYWIYGGFLNGFYQPNQLNINLLELGKKNICSDDDDNPQYTLMMRGEMMKY